MCMNTKLCPGCKETKHFNSFAINRLKKDGLQVYCRSCKKKIDARHYEENKKAQQNRNKINRDKFKDEISEYKKSLGCKFCNENDSCCLDFHHIDSDLKEDNVSTMRGKIGKEKVWEEIKKCVVVCANCHRKLHAGKLTI